MKISKDLQNWANLDLWWIDGLLEFNMSNFDMVTIGLACIGILLLLIYQYIELCSLEKERKKIIEELQDKTGQRC
jgi:hypothetical protein